MSKIGELEKSWLADDDGGCDDETHRIGRDELGQTHCGGCGRLLRGGLYAFLRVHVRDIKEIFRDGIHIGATLYRPMVGTKHITLVIEFEE